MARTPFIAGNWKMFKTIPEAVETATALKEAVSDVWGRTIVIMSNKESNEAAVLEDMKGAFAPLMDPSEDPAEGTLVDE